MASFHHRHMAWSVTLLTDFGSFTASFNLPLVCSQKPPKCDHLIEAVQSRDADLRCVFSRHTGEVPTNSRTTNVPEIQSTENTTGSLLILLFCDLKEGTWWQIFPVENNFDCDSISCGMGFSWEDLLPLLACDRLIVAVPRSIVNGHTVSEVTHSEWHRSFATAAASRELACDPGCDTAFSLAMLQMWENLVMWQLTPMTWLATNLFLFLGTLEQESVKKWQRLHIVTIHRTKTRVQKAAKWDWEINGIFVTASLLHFHRKCSQPLKNFSTEVNQKSTAMHQHLPWFFNLFIWCQTFAMKLVSTSQQKPHQCSTYTKRKFCLVHTVCFVSSTQWWILCLWL